MANSLTLRLTQTDPDPDRHIPLNPFVEALFSVLGGWHTTTQLENFWSMTPSDITAFGVLTGKVQSAPNLTSKGMRVHRIRSILTFWEMGEVPGYLTEDDVESQLLGIDDGP